MSEIQGWIQKLNSESKKRRLIFFSKHSFCLKIITYHKRGLRYVIKWKYNQTFKKFWWPIDAWQKPYITTFNLLKNDYMWQKWSKNYTIMTKNHDLAIFSVLRWRRKTHNMSRWRAHNLLLLKEIIRLIKKIMKCYFFKLWSSQIRNYSK